MEYIIHLTAIWGLTAVAIGFFVGLLLPKH